MRIGRVAGSDCVTRPDSWVRDRLGAEKEPEAPKEPTKRLTFDVPKSLHARVKAKCAAEEKFMNEEIIKLLEARWSAPT